MEQQFKLRRIKDLLPQAKREDLYTLIESLQHQNFCLANTVSNLVKEWPTLMTVQNVEYDQDESTTLDA
jgi:hypothetical protein